MSLQSGPKFIPFASDSPGTMGTNDIIIRSKVRSVHIGRSRDGGSVILSITVQSLNTTLLGYMNK